MSGIVHDCTFRVELPGHGVFAYVRLDGQGSLAPLHHVDETGNPTVAATFGTEDSYAHAYRDGTIKRYGKQIAREDDLVIVGACPVCHSEGWR